MTAGVLGDSLSMTIDGKAVGGADRFAVENPANNATVGYAPECSRDQLDQAMASSAAAFDAWRTDEATRREALCRLADVVTDAADDLAPLLVAEQGKPLRDAKRELLYSAKWFRYYADLEVSTTVVQDDDKAFVDVHLLPIGPVAAITPWNFPIVQAAWKLAPALLAGCTLVLKPSPYTPLTTLALGARMNTVLPAGVVNVVSGGDELGRWMVEHPAPRKISFTGSTNGGMHVARAAAFDLKRVTLELGGNDAAIVLDDADVDAVATGIFGAAFANCGQVCMAVKRVFVPRHLYSPMVAALADRASSTTIGNGMRDSVDMGPICNKAQFERISSLVADARQRGARIAAGGRPGSEGYLYEPTIVCDIAEGVELVDGEQFGPALPVMAYDSIDEAVSRANNSRFGLSGSVWGTDIDQAAEVAERLECGTTWVNTHRTVSPAQPIGGVKWSGIGRENGVWGLRAFTEPRVRSLPPRNNPSG